MVLIQVSSFTALTGENYALFPKPVKDKKNVEIFQINVQ